MMTLLAATRLMPREPARVEMRNKRPLGRHEKAGEGVEIMLKTHLGVVYVAGADSEKQTCQLNVAYLVLLVSLNSSAHFFLVVALVEPSRR